MWRTYFDVFSDGVLVFAWTVGVKLHKNSRRITGEFIVSGTLGLSMDFFAEVVPRVVFFLCTCVTLGACFSSEK